MRKQDVFVGGRELLLITSHNFENKCLMHREMLSTHLEEVVNKHFSNSIAQS